MTKTNTSVLETLTEEEIACAANEKLPPEVCSLCGDVVTVHKTVSGEPFCRECYGTYGLIFAFLKGNVE